MSLAGFGNLWNEDKIHSDNLSVSLAGSGDITLDLETTLVKEAIAGSGDFHGFNLQSNSTKVSIAGSDDAQVVSNETLKANVAGSGNISSK